MSDQPTEKPDAPAPAAGEQNSAILESKPEQTDLSAKEEAKKEETSKPAEEPKPAATEDKSEKESGEKDKPSIEGDSEMPDAPDTSAVEGDQAGAVAEKTPLSNAKNNRRKSAGGGNRKSLNKKASKAKMTHLDAKPGDHFLVKLKGFPEWPAIICDESMLPHALLNTRPVTAKRADGTYAEAYADGGKRAQDRNYPVMFLQTNEFAWVVNTALTELDSEIAEKRAQGPKVRKDLKLAFELATAQHDIDYYKGVLEEHEKERIAAQEAAAAAAATPKKSKKKNKGGEEDEDVDMADADASVKSKTKKRKAEDGSDTPQRPDSVKKPKIKLNTNSTPKGTNGSAAKDSAKAKPKKKTPKETAPQETPEEALKRKQKEVLYLRYKLQRGLLSKEGKPQEDEMVNMSKFIDMLEAMPDLEGAIIRETRINKVMKQILKLDSIPKESEFKFKSRSQELLNKWNKVMASDGAAPAPASAAPSTNGANGVNGTKSPTEEKKSEPGEDKPEAKAEAKPENATEEEQKPEEKKDAEVPKPEAGAESTEPAKPAESETKAEEPAKEAPAVAA